ncbi:MAG: MFS transporter [Thermoplasmata archaeon]
MSAGEQIVGSDPLLRAVFGATFFVRFGFGITLAVFATYILGHPTGLSADDIGVVGWISAAAPIGEFTTVIASGIAADRYGRLRVLLWGLAAASVLMLLVASTRSPWALGGLNLAFGVSSGAILASSLAVVTDASAVQARGYAMGRFDAMNLLGWVLGFAVGFGVLGSVPPSKLFLVFLLGGAVLTIGYVLAYLLTRRAPRPPRLPSTQLGMLRTAILEREVLLVAFPWLVIYMLIGTVFVFLGTAAAAAGLPIRELAVLIGGGGLLLLVTQPVFGRMADRYGRLQLTLVGTAGFVGILVVAILLGTYGPRPLLLGLLGASTLAALAYGPAALASLGDLTHAYTRATTMSVYTLAISLGMILGLLGSTTLLKYYGIPGLDVFFGLIAVALVVLTSIRVHDIRVGIAASPSISSSPPSDR